MTTQLLLAYHNDPDLKLKLIQQLQAHREADAIVQGTYGQEADNAVGFQGCAVGCTLHSLYKLQGHDRHVTGDHAEYPRLLGFPMTLAKIQDAIHEGLPEMDAREWPLQFAEAVPVGVDLSHVVDKFLLAVLDDPKFGVLQYADEGTRPAIEAVAALYRRKIAGEIVSVDEWRSAASARSAWSAAAAAAAAAASESAASASAAAWSAAAAAAWSAWSAWSAAAAAAWSARSAAAAAAAAWSAWKEMRDHLLGLLRALQQSLKRSAIAVNAERGRVGEDSAPTQ